MAVRKPARFIYFGIEPQVGPYVSRDGVSNFSDWPMYQLINYVVETEERGSAYFITVQVSDGSPEPVDRNANRLANSLGPPVGHPSMLIKEPNEFIMMRVLHASADGSLTIEGMIKGSEAETAARPIAKNTYVGVQISGSVRDHHGMEAVLNAKPRSGKDSSPESQIKPAMSNQEIEDKKTKMHMDELSPQNLRK